MTRRRPRPQARPRGGRGSPRLALIARHGRDEAITQVYPEARVMADADDGVGLHEERSV